MNQEDSIIMTSGFVQGTPTSYRVYDDSVSGQRLLVGEPRWLTFLRATAPNLSQAELEVIRKLFQKSGLVVCPRPAYCSCENFRPGTAPGYKGQLDPVCLSCVQHCRRCKQPSTDCHYDDNVCYGCACGDNDEVVDEVVDEESDEESEESVPSTGHDYVPVMTFPQFSIPPPPPM